LLIRKARWFGYIQGVLVINGVISVEKERKLTRPIFRNIYIATNEYTKTITV